MNQALHIQKKYSRNSHFSAPNVQTPPPPTPPSAGATPTASPKTHESGKSEEGRPRELAQEGRSRRVV